MLSLTIKNFLAKTTFCFNKVRLRSVQKIYRKYSTVFKMNTAYFRHVDDEKNFHVSFKLHIDELGISKECNMCRRMDETADVFLKRLGSNVGKILEKKTKKLKKKAEKDGLEFDDIEVKAFLFCNDAPVANTFVCKKFFDTDEKNVFSIQVLDVNLNIIINSPWISKVTLPTHIMSGFYIYPIKIEHFNMNENQSCFKWSKSMDGKQWEDCGEGFYYKVSSKDIGQKLKLVITPYNESKVGPSFEVVIDRVLPGPGLCPFEKRHEMTKYNTGSNSFRVLSYNILAESYSETSLAKEVLFSYCPAEALDFNYRRQLLIKEILGYNCDLICLQEVESKFFNNDLLQMLKFQNLTGIFCEKGGNSCEGVACFYSDKKFNFLSSKQVILSEELESNEIHNELWKNVNKNEELVQRLKGRKTVLQIVVLQSVEKPDEIIVVGNTHLYFHPNADHVRLLQGVICLSQLQDTLSKLIVSTKESYISLIFCGDFNSVPECGIYKLLTTKSISEDVLDWKSCPGEEIVGISYNHELNIESSYGTPDYTNFTKEFKACLDYIYYQTDRLKVKSIAPLPSLEELSQHIAIPSVVFPSDHVALVTDFEWDIK